MSGPVPYVFGVRVNCEDGECGKLARVVVDSYEYALIRLVVEPKGAKSQGRAVPIDFVTASTEHEVRIRCSTAQFEAFDRLEGTEVHTASTVDVESQWAELRTMERPVGGHVDLGMGLRPERRTVAEDDIREGEGEIWGGQHVHASDGPIGHVRGLITDVAGRQMTYVLLGEGHLWGEKEVAIPISAVKYVFDDGVHVNLTRENVGELPSVNSSQ